MSFTLPTVPRPLRYAGIVCLALAVLLASIVDPGGGLPRTLLGIGFTTYLHVLAYAGLAAVSGYALASAERRTLLAVAALVTLYGAAIELLQGTIPYRTMAASDAATNAVGAALGATLWWLVSPWFGIARGG
ncbi:VanZ family protein [Natronomonas sp. F2-12]|uniref:VanZ family protein n=1 Tax=Natronomonas aquatica TaxID=2841590 RepID=A0A9R1D6W4_9EURY|nr:VanZ family protein [Natronomonas aquatica]